MAKQQGLFFLSPKPAPWLPKIISEGVTSKTLEDILLCVETSKSKGSHFSPNNTHGHTNQNKFHSSIGAITFWLVLERVLLSTAYISSICVSLLNLLFIPDCRPDQPCWFWYHCFTWSKSKCHALDTQKEYCRGFRGRAHRYSACLACVMSWFPSPASVPQ